MRGHGLIAATADQGTAEWGCDYTATTGAVGTAIGQGQNNTNLIIANCGTAGIAARICDAYVSGIYTDWYLPSKDELTQLYNNRYAIGGFNLSAYGTYWASGEWHSHVADGMDFSNGTSGGYYKSYVMLVRPIRSF